MANMVNVDENLTLVRIYFYLLHLLYFMRLIRPCICLNYKAHFSLCPNALIFQAASNLNGDLLTWPSRW